MVIPHEIKVYPFEHKNAMNPVNTIAINPSVTRIKGVILLFIRVGEVILFKIMDNPANSQTPR
jgi:hypothetical protein